MYHYYVRYSGINNCLRKKVDGSAEIILKEPIISVEQIKKVTEIIKRGNDFKNEQNWDIFIDFYELLRKDD